MPLLVWPPRRCTALEEREEGAWRTYRLSTHSQCHADSRLASVSSRHCAGCSGSSGGCRPSEAMATPAGAAAVQFPCSRGPGYEIRMSGADLSPGRDGTAAAALRRRSLRRHVTGAGWQPRDLRAQVTCWHAGDCMHGMNAPQSCGVPGPWRGGLPLAMSLSSCCVGSGWIPG